MWLCHQPNFSRDDVESIKAGSYRFFKGTLDNKIVEYRFEDQEDLKHKKEMDMHWQGSRYREPFSV